MVRTRRSAPIALHSKMLIAAAVIAVVSLILGEFVHDSFYRGFLVVVLLLVYLIICWAWGLFPFGIGRDVGDRQPVVEGKSALARRKGFPDETTSQDDDIKVRLQRLEELREAGLVSEDEYLTKREAILGEI